MTDYEDETYDLLAAAINSNQVDVNLKTAINLDVTVTDDETMHSGWTLLKGRKTVSDTLYNNTTGNSVEIKNLILTSDAGQYPAGQGVLKWDDNNADITNAFAFVSGACSPVVIPSIILPNGSYIYYYEQAATVTGYFFYYREI